MRDDMPHLLKEAQQNCLNGRSDFKHPNSKGLFYGTGKSHGKLAMIFPGQGSQYTDMARDLICTFPEALSILDKADTIWTGEGRLSDRMFPVPNSDPTEKEIRERRLRHTHAAQMALGTVEAGMLGILRRFDISAEAYCGHSYGELAALYAAGWIDLETLFVLSDSRGRSMAQAGNGASKESGTMLAVAAPLDQIELLAEKLAPEVVLANRNSLTQGVLSGSRAGIDKAMTSCKEKGWRAVELPVAAAFHSPLIRTALAPFSESVQSAPLRPTEIPVYSNRTAQPYPVEPDQAKELLVGQMVSAVDFVGMIQHLYDSGVTTFLEVGPKKVLSGLIKGILPSRDIQLLSLDGSAGNKNGLEDLARTLCSLAASGRFVNLDAWGSECEEPRRPRMQVMLSGANYRSAKQTNRSAQAMTPSASAEKRSAVNAPKALKKTAGLSASPKPAIPTAADHPSHPVPQTTAENHHLTTPISEAIRPMTTKAPISAPHANVQDALAVVQQGIQSMQALHLQTAQTHQKFLEAQAEAGRTLQAMIHQTQTLTGRTTPGIPVMEHRTGISPETPHAPTGSSIPPYRDQTSLPESLPAPSVAPTIPAVTPAMPSSPQAPQTRAAAPAASVPTNSSAGNDIQSTLLTVVGDLTGYPEEMLELDMDIESDLGIDSIKRVEILSTLEERLPGLPSITPDMLGTLTTLGQIIEFLTGRGETASAVPPSPPATAPSDNSGAKIEKTLLAVVGELTGYPGEMLELDMDIESDLGIDSIKRVEILSTLEERMPGLPSVTPDMLGTLKTLGQIVEFLADSGGVPPAKTSAVPKAEPEKSSKQVQETLLAVVSELTGYPDEMLELDMDIESDLGIDSIKRVEILSTLEERLPGLPAVTPDMLGTLKTLGQIVAYLAGPQGASEETPRSRTGNSDQCRPEKIRTAVLAVVGELTGYPEEMLELDMDIESDLGIDSIKRVEILSTLEERMPDLPAVTPDMLGSLKTLGQIVDYLAGSAPAAARQTDAPLSPPDNAESPQTALPAKSSSTPKEAMRRLVTLRDLAVPTPNTDARIPTAGRIYITQDKAGLSRSLAEALKSRGCQVSIIEPDAHPIPNGFADAAGLILMPPIEACDAFKLAQAAGPQLIRKARSHQSLFASISRLDGAFGFYGRKMDDPLQGALAGLTKTAAREWQGVICRSLDISPDWQDLEQISKAAADLLLSDPESVPPEVGLSESHVVAPELTPAPRETGSISLSPQDVLIVTGGGRGVTAEAALALAQAAPCRMVLLGRSPNPCQEPDWLAGIKGPKEIKKAILTHEFKGQKAHPKEVEARFRFWQANREIHATLTRISATGAQITYFQQDVLETATLPSLFEKIRRDFGPIKGLIHGAGVLHDRLILEKEPAQFERVYRTKVDALTALLAALESDDLKYLVLFSSVSARIGNKGQADYAMANEVLNKMAWQQRQRRPQCKVVSINWGPWDGGMVDPGLKREFQRQGVSLIPLHDGAQAMVTEMSTAVDEPAEVVIGATFETGETSVAPLSPPLGSPLKLAAKVAATNEAPLAVLFKREIDIESYPILSDHVLAGRPVVPLALMTEWLGHSALHENPGLMFHGIDNLRLMSGIKLANTKRIIQLMAGKPRRKDSLFEVDVEIRNGSTDDRAAIHSRATALLTDKLPAPPRYGRLEFEGESPAANKSPADFYQETLFHGEQLQGIRSILNISSQGMAAQLSTAPDPQSWMSAPLRSQWILDPLVLDCAFQMAIIWCHEQLGKRCLPSFAARYRQYRETFPHEGVNAHLTVHKANAAKMIGDFTFLDHKGGLVAQMTGYEAVIDATLDKAFNQKNAA